MRPRVWLLFICTLPACLALEPGESVDPTPTPSPTASPTPSPSPSPTAPSATGISAIVTWDTSVSDIDLHFVNETQGGTFYTEPWDCFFANPNPNWGMTTSSNDDPTLTRDDDGFGPEVLEHPFPDGSVFHFYVHDYEDAAASVVTIHIFLDGNHVLHNTRSLSNDRVWDVATIDMPEGTITPIDTDFPNPN